MEVRVSSNILDANDRLAEQTRRRLTASGILALNLIGSPGCGKTTLLERTLEIAKERGRIRPGVIEGDIATSRDTERIQKLGVPVVQINTRGACHLDARMVAGVLGELPLGKLDVLFIENVGNLVCPADFEVGEHAKVVVLSTAEGEDKPQKYPCVFRLARAAVITKVDLLPHLEFDMKKLYQDMDAIRQDQARFPLSAKTGEGCEAWVDWIERTRQEYPLP
jgi:hydrogenase nickel incorporation protein HypB